MYPVVLTFIVGLTNFCLFGIHTRQGQDIFFAEDLKGIYLSAKSHLILSFQDTTKTLSPETRASSTSFPSFLPKHVQNSSINHGALMNKNVDVRERNQWIQNTADMMTNDVQDLVSRELEIQEYSDKAHHYYRKSVKIFTQETSRLTFSDGSFLIFKNHSVYDNEKIGDVTLAINEKNRVYRNDGHICGGIIHFVEMNQREIRTSHDFIRYFKSDTDDKGWVILRGSN